MTTARLLISADSELGNAIRDLQRVNTELGETARAAQRAASDVGGAGNGMLGSLRRVAEFAAGGLLTGGITALVGAFGQAASAGMEFGTTINRIQALAGATAGEMGAVEAKALELGAALPLSASQAAEGIQELVAGGMSLNDALAAATGTAQLAASQLMPVGDAASIVSAALNSFGLAAGEAGRVSDVLSMAANKSASSVPELGEALKYVGGVAGSLSQPLEGTAAAIGLMANAGIQGSMAGTALRATLTELATPSKATASALEQMGVATVNSAGQMRPFMDIAADMRQAMDGMSDSQKTMIANTIAGTPGMAGFLAVLNASPDSFNEMRAAMESATGATAAFGQATGQGAAFALEQLKGSIETVLVQGFRAVEPALVTVLSAVTAFVNQTGAGFAQLTPTIQQFASQAGVGLAQVTAIIDQMQPAVAFVTEHWRGFATALGGFAGLIVGSQVAGLIVAVTTAVGSMSAAVTVAGGLLPWIGGLIAALGGPITLIIAALAALAVAYATNFLGIRDLVDQVVTFLNGLWAQHGDQIVAVAQQAWGLIQSAVETALGVVAQLWSAWNSAREGDWRGFGEQLRVIWDAAWNAIVGVVSTVGPQVLAAIVSLLGQARDAFVSVDWGELGRNIIAGVAQGISSAAGRIADAARQAAQNALDAAKGFLGIQSPSRVMADEVGRPIAEGLAAGILAGAPDAINAMLFVAGNIGSVARQLVNTVQGYGRGLGNELEALQDLASGMGGVVSIINDVGDALVRLGEVGQSLDASGAAAGLANALATIARVLIDAMQASGRGLGSEVERLQDLANGIQAVASIMAGIQAALDSMAGLPLADLPSLDTLSETFRRLAAWAAEMTRAAQEVAGTVSADLAPNLEALGDAAGAAAGVAAGALALAKALVDALTFDWTAVNWGEARDMLVGLVDLSEFLVGYAAQAATGFQAVGGELAALKTALDPLTGIVSSVTDLAALLVDALAYDWGATDWGQARDMLVGLVTLGHFMAYHAGQAAAAFTALNTGGLSPLRDALGPVVSIATDAFRLVELLADNMTVNLDPARLSAMNILLYNLAIWARNFATAVALAAAAFASVNTTGVAPLRDALAPVVAIVDDTLASIAAIQAAAEVGLPDVSEESAIDRLLYQIAVWGRNLVTAAGLATATLATVNLSGLKPLVDALKTIQPIVEGTLGAIAAVVALDADDLPDLSQETAIDRALRDLVIWGRNLVLAASLGVGALTEAQTAGLQPLADALTTIQPIIDGTLQATAAVLAFDQTSLPDVSQESAINRALYNLVIWARNLASAAALGAAAFGAVNTDGLRPLMRALRDTFDLLGQVTQVPELIAQLDQVAAVDFDQLRARVAAIMPVLADIARSFAEEADRAGISEAWAEAGQRVAGVIGDAVGALGNTIDVALRLVDPELMLPSVAQLAPRLRAVLALMREAVTAFAAEADSIQIDQDAATRLANTVKPITDALGGLIELVQSFNGLNLGMSGYNNLRSFMSMIFDTFTDFAPDAGQVQAVVNALTSALSGLGNLMQSLGAQHGQSYASAFVAAVQAGLAQGLAPSAPGATPAPLPPAPGQGGGTVVNNYFTLNQYGVGAATAGAAAASFMGMKATIGAAP